MADDRVWLQHPEHGGYFACPVAAVAEWTSDAMGWQVADAPPPDPNPTLVEHPALTTVAEPQTSAEQIIPTTRTRRGAATKSEE